MRTRAARGSDSLSTAWEVVGFGCGSEATPAPEGATLDRARAGPVGVWVSTGVAASAPCTTALPPPKRISRLLVAPFSISPTRPPEVANGRLPTVTSPRTTPLR